MDNERHYLNQIYQMDRLMEQIIGRKVFGHVSHPTPTSTRITFADGHVALSMVDAYEYMIGLVGIARDDPAKLPWPLSEPLESEAAPRSGQR